MFSLLAILILAFAFLVLVITFFWVAHILAMRAQEKKEAEKLEPIEELLEEFEEVEESIPEPANRGKGYGANYGLLLGILDFSFDDGTVFCGAVLQHSSCVAGIQILPRGGLPGVTRFFVERGIGGAAFSQSGRATAGRAVLMGRWTEPENRFSFTVDSMSVHYRKTGEWRS